MECMKGILLEKFQSKSAVIGIFGLGYVGLPLAIRFVEAGFNVIGFDIDEEKIINLESGKSYFKHIDDSKVASAVSSGLSATTDFSQLVRQTR